jgi:hypothetical protein
MFLHLHMALMYMKQQLRVKVVVNHVAKSLKNQKKRQEEIQIIKKRVGLVDKYILII